MQRALVRMYGILPRGLSSRIVHLFSPSFAVGVPVVVLNRKEQVLMLHHTYHEPRWRLPGGLMERREQPFDTATREVREEACCDVQPVAVLDAVVTPYSFDVVVLATLVLEREFEESAEIDGRRWMNINAFSEMDPAYRRWIEAAKQRLVADSMGTPRITFQSGRTLASRARRETEGDAPRE